MASGKSTVGPPLAARLGWSFADLDARIEQAASCSIPEIFEAEGEDGFRQREAAALRATAAEENVVVALGGGTFAQPENVQWMLGKGVVVYLCASAGELARRLAPAAAGRPLLCDAEGQPLAGDALRSRIAALLAERTPYYEQARLTVDTDARGVEATVDAIAAALPLGL